MLATALCRRAFAGLDKLTDEDRAALFLIRALHAALELRKEIRRANVVQGHRRSRDEKKHKRVGAGPQMDLLGALRGLTQLDSSTTTTRD